MTEDAQWLKTRKKRPQSFHAKIFLMAFLCSIDEKKIWQCFDDKSGQFINVNEKKLANFSVLFRGIMLLFWPW